MKWSSISTKPKILLAVSVPLTMLIVLGVISLSSISSMNTTSGWVSHTYKALMGAQNIVASAVDMETGMRGFLLAGKEEFLEPYKKGSEEIYDRIETLQQMVSDNDVQVKRLAEVEATMREWQSKITEPMIAKRREVGSSMSMDDIATLVGEARGKVYFDKFRALIGEFSAMEKSLLSVREEANQTTETNTFNTVFGGIALAVLLGGGIGWFIGSGIAGPITDMTRAMLDLANGNKGIVVPGTSRGDEIGKMAGAVQIFKESMIRSDELAAKEAAELESREARARQIEQMTMAFETNVAELLEAVAGVSTEMEGTAGSMSQIANDTSQRAVSVASAAEQASGNVQTVASATEELASSIREISRQVSQSSSIAQNAVEQAGATDKQVQGLSLAAQRIGDVINMISDIAEQTNLLALNATIEAARAGEAGKGFAVVASEVKSLASQTAKATGDIGVQISAIQSETDSAVKAIQAIGQTIDEMNSIASGIATAVEEQTSATSEIAQNVDQAAQGTQEVTGNINRVTQSASECGTAASQVSSTAQELSSKSEQLKARVEEFLLQVRSA